MLDDRLRDHIERAVKSDMLDQAYIFEGAKGTGRTELAMYTAGLLLCDSDINKRPCGECHACKLIESGNHPDLRIIRHESRTTVKIEEIREQLIGDISIRPYYGGRKIYIIPNAELMSIGAQNAILKTIEEPPEYALIILIADSGEKLLSTIRSRCITLSFRAEPVYHPDDEAVDSCFKRVEDILSGRHRPDMSEIMGFAKELSAGYKDYLPELFTHIECICRDALLAKSGIYLTENTATGYIDKTARITYEGLEKILKATKSSRHDIQMNVSAEAVLESLLIHIKNAVVTTGS
ncbi:MAG: hypothetical protein K6G42_10190 [Lachnospiraceae bacterium]|nr:hypothetical protein [Lachnospiraceae bacterium]